MMEMCFSERQYITSITTLFVKVFLHRTFIFNDVDYFEADQKLQGETHMLLKAAFRQNYVSKSYMNMKPCHII